MGRSNKPNPLLAKYEAKLQHEYQCRLHVLTEMSLIAHMVSTHNVMGVDQECAETLQNEFVQTLNTLADMLVSDSKDDKDLWHTKYQLEKALRDILGDEVFEKNRHLYSLLVEET